MNGNNFCFPSPHRNYLNGKSYGLFQKYRLPEGNGNLCGIADLHMKVGERQVLDEFCRSSANNMAPQLVKVNVRKTLVS